jgi:hypothetical protein
MDKLTFCLVNHNVRLRACEAIMKAPDDYRVEIKPRTRSLDQNARLWAMLTDVANAKPEGRHWTPETWKAAFMHLLGHQVRFCEGLDGSGPFPLGFRSSNLTVRQMSDLMECISEYGARHGVEWTDTVRGGFMEKAA